jgi:hypothetical protein
LNESLSALPERRISDLIHDLTPMREAQDLAGLFAGMARSILGALKADACLVSLLDRDRDVLRDAAASTVGHASLNSVATEYPLSDFPLTRKVIFEGGSVEISTNDPDADPVEKEYMEGIGFERMLMCRFIVEGTPMGTVEAYRLDDRPFRKDDPAQVDLLAAFAGGAYSRIQLAEQLEEHYTKTMEALTSALEARDPYTEAHTSRIRDVALGLAAALKVGEDVRRSVMLGSILHDVGKIGISDSILLKPGPLTDEEWAIMRTHPEIGERMLKSVDFLAPALPVVRHHHERWDGKGYPDGLAGDDIPLGARIVAACDTFDAMTSDRPYRKALGREEACQEILRVAGGQLDPMCASVLVDVVTNLGEGDLEERFVRYAT